MFEERGGFDAIIANPPYIGASRISGVLDFQYREFIVRRIARNCRGLADYSAYFVLRALDILRNEANAGLVTTKTIAQGETKKVGLEQAIANGTHIFRAIAARKWPGEAKLHVSHLWLRKGRWRGEFVLDNQNVSAIMASLTASKVTRAEPRKLRANKGICLRGSELMAKGFILSSEMAASLLGQPENRNVIRRYLGRQGHNR